MRSRFTMLDGASVSVDAPQASLAAPIAIGVLFADPVEIEVNAGSSTARQVFLEATGTELTSAVTLRGGRTLRVGPLGGSKANGWGFTVDVGAHHLFGPAPPTMTVARLAALLSAAAPQATSRGPVLTPRGQLGWSPYRTHGASQVATLASGAEVALDIRRAVPGRTQGARGVRVRGGMLTRSSEKGREHVILESAAFVTYGLPAPGTSLDALAGFMATVVVSTP